MKKVLFVAAALLAGSAVFSVSYKNNTYQKLADEYTKKAQNALDAGEYELSVEYSQKAEENAALSQAYIKKMLAKAEADKAMKKASDRIAFAKKISADRNFPMAYSAAEQAYASAKDVYAKEDYVAATDYANQVLAALADIREVTPLPEYYVVRPWAETKDCYWNISGRTYVYNNPLLWENLYQANKQSMPKPNDPNLIHPGMKMKIPSITGEYREGVYNPAKKYDTYSAVASSRPVVNAKPAEAKSVEPKASEAKAEPAKAEQKSAAAPEKAEPAKTEQKQGASLISNSAPASPSVSDAK